MSALGIYFGPRDIGIVSVKGNKASGCLKISRSSLGTGDLETEERVPFEVKIVAVLKDELRKAKIEAKEAALCLGGNDLIIRTFEMQPLPKEEMQSAINFEAKKYIPFKIEELITDYQLQPDRATHKNAVLFVGIKKETLEQYVSILHQLNIKITAIEYSAFSLLGALKLSGLEDRGVVAVLGADLNEEDEVNFTVLEDGYPLFSRDISLASGPEGLAKAEAGGPEPGMSLEKLKTEVRVSLDYYHRKFPAKNIHKLFFVINPESRQEFEGFLKELGLISQFVETARLTGAAGGFSLVGLKASGAALYRTLKTNLKINLLSAKQKEGLPKPKPIKIEAISFKDLKLDPKFLLLGALICLASFGLAASRTAPLRNELKSVISQRPQAAKVNANAAYAELSGISAGYKKKLETLDNLVKKQLYLTLPLDAIPRCLPKGVWLTRLSFQKREQDEGKADLILEGVAFLGDSNKELEAVNEFLRNLKTNPGLSGYFKDMSIVSIDNRKEGKLALTSFNISCKTYTKGKE